MLSKNLKILYKFTIVLLVFPIVASCKIGANTTIQASVLENVDVVESILAEGSSVQNITHNENGKLYVKGSQYSYIFDESNGNLIRTLPEGRFSQNEKFFISGEYSDSKSITIWNHNVSPIKKIKTLTANYIDFSADDKFAIVTYRNAIGFNIKAIDTIEKVEVWHTDNWQLLYTLKDKVASIGNSTLITEVKNDGNPDPIITRTLRSIDTGEKLDSITFSRYYYHHFNDRVSYSPDNQYVIVSGYYGETDIFHLHNFKFKKIKEFVAPSSTLPNWSQNSQLFSVDKHIYNLSNGNLIADLSNITNSASIFSPDKQRMITAYTKSHLDRAHDSIVQVWDTDTKQLLFSINTNHTSQIREITFSNNGKMLFTSGSDGAIKQWRLSDGQFIKEMRAHHKRARFTLSPNGKILAIPLKASNNVELWDVATNKMIAKLSGTPAFIHYSFHDQQGHANVLFSQDSSKLLVRESGNDELSNSIKIWEVTTGKFIKTINTDEIKNYVPMGVSFDGVTIPKPPEAYELDKTIYDFNQTTLAQLILSDNTINIYDLNSEQRLHSLQSPSKPYLVALTKDSSFVAVMRQNTTESVLDIWQLPSGKLVKSFPNHFYTEALALDFTNDGTRLVVGSGRSDYNNSITIYGTPDKKAIFLNRD